MPKKSSRGKSPTKSKKRGKPSYSARKTRRIKKARQVKILLSLGLAFLFAISISFQLIGNSSPKALTPTPKPSKTASPAPSTANTVKASPIDPYTQVDSMAIVGVFALARQTPSSSSKEFQGFLKKIQVAKNDSAKSTLDLAILGNRLVDYSISKNGLLDPVCYAVKAPMVVNQSPKQSTWVIYFEPASKTKSALVLVSLGVTNCSQATLATSRISSNAERIKISNASHQIIETAINKVPASFLSPVGLALLDETRGLAPTPKASK